jgi:hypothetical protein
LPGFLRQFFQIGSVQVHEDETRFEQVYQSDSQPFRRIGRGFVHVGDDDIASFDMLQPLFNRELFHRRVMILNIERIEMRFDDGEAQGVFNQSFLGGEGRR